MPHWRTMLSSDKLHAADLMGREVTLQIERVIAAEYPDLEDSRKKITKPDVYFVGRAKPLGLNSTNGRAISKLLGSPITEHWGGRFITLYPTTTRAFGEEHECIRIKNRLPAEDRGPQQQRRNTQPQQQRQPSPAARGTGSPAPDRGPDDIPPPMSPEEIADIERRERQEARK